MKIKISREIRLVLTVAVCVLLLAISISSVAREPIVGRNNVAENEEQDKTTTKPSDSTPKISRSSDYPNWFQRIFNFDWNTWSSDVGDMYSISEGNVGIGTTVPGEKLTVDGNIRIENYGDGIIFPDGTKQTTAAMPSWSQILPANERFELCLNDEAVLDRETGLVWARDARILDKLNWEDAYFHIFDINIGNRQGWRLPTAEEISSLIDPSQSYPALPSGHPFVNVPISGPFWTCTTSNLDYDYVYILDIGDGHVSHSYKNLWYDTWPVRGGQGPIPVPHIPS